MSLSLSGALSGYLVQQLQYNDALDQMAKQALLLRPTIQRIDCQRCALTPEELSVQLDSNLESMNLGSSRLILLGGPARLARRSVRVLYDSYGRLPEGTQVPLGRESLVSGQPVREGRPTLDGEEYLAAGATATLTRNVVMIIVAQPQARVAAQAAGQLATPILESAGAGLSLAIVVTFLLARAFTRPLAELRRASEDVAGGNYARRVRNTGPDEIGVVGQSFNRMAEAVERTRHQQRTFLANVSHELKTPLTSLIGFSQALMDGSLRTDEEKARAATILNEEAQRVLRMSQELLDLARVESGQLALNPHPVDLSVQLHQELEIVRKRAEDRRLALRLSVQPGLPPVWVDPDRLHQILENLLDNAVKYAPEGTTVWITSEAAPPGVGPAGVGPAPGVPLGVPRISTAIRNRVGVSPPDPARMFDRFYRGDPSRSSAGGVGLGLAISRELAIAQNGDLRAELGADGSLCLRLDLPAVRPQAPIQSQPRGPVRLEPRPQPRA